MVFGTGGRPLLPDTFGDDVDETYLLRNRIKELEKEVVDLRRQLMLAKNTNMLYENSEYGRIEWDGKE